MAFDPRVNSPASMLRKSATDVPGLTLEIDFERETITFHTITETFIFDAFAPARAFLAGYKAGVSHGA